MAEKKDRPGRTSKRWNAYIDSGKYKDALNICENELKSNPSDTKVWVRKGLTFGFMHQYEKAVEAFEVALNLKPDSALIWNAMGQALAYLNRDDEALESANKALEIKPEYKGAWITKGRILGFMRRHKESLQAFDKALEIEPNDAHALVHKGETLQALGSYKEALEAFDEALKLKPNDAYTLACKGETLQALGSYEEALKAIDEALRLEPNYVDALFRKAIILASSGKYQDALKVLEAVLLLKPNYADAWYQKGRILLYEKRFHEAVEASDEVLKLKPDNANAWANKGTALLNMRRLDEALDAFNQATKLEPAYIDAWGRKAGILALMDRYNEALEAFDRALKLKPDYEEIWRFKGMTFLNMKRYTDALKSLNAAIKLKPDDGDALYFKGLVLTQMNKLPAAKKCFEESAKCFNAVNDVEGGQSARSWLTSIKNRIEEETNKTKPSIETEIIRKVRTLLKTSSDDPFQSISQREKDIAAYFDKKRTIQPNDCFFLVLRRWNSFTPTIPNRGRIKKGGGYFLVWKGKGVVIDPGFDFLDNFDKAGFSIDDIDAVVLTHAHTDHTADLENLLCLKHELSEHGHNQDSSKLDLFMNLGSIHKFIGWISMLKIAGKVITLNADDLIEPQGYSWSLKPTYADHSEVIGKNCLGLIFHLKDGSKEVLQLGITGDTIWSKEIERQYKGCKLLCVHLGSIQRSEFDESLPLKSSKRLYQGQHLGLIGTISIIKSVKPLLAIISEFGEELGNDRCHIANSIDHAFGKDRRCLTGDIGLKVRLPDLSVYCFICDNYRDYTSIQECDVRDNLVYHCFTHTPKEFAHKFIV